MERITGIKLMTKKTEWKKLAHGGFGQYNYR